jgi:hypothetical protein
MARKALGDFVFLDSPENTVQPLDIHLDPQNHINILRKYLQKELVTRHLRITA